MMPHRGREGFIAIDAASIRQVALRLIQALGRDLGRIAHDPHRLHACNFSLA
jgi:hypothetical protein